ncbi:MAG: ABC transporter permease, partial [Pseudomonadota bacterium]
MSIIEGAGRPGRYDPDEHWVAPDDGHDAGADLRRPALDDGDVPTRVLIWRRFRRHRVGYVCFLLMAAVYLALPFVEVLSPYLPNQINEDAIYAPPQGLYLFHEGSYVGLHTYPTATVYDVETGLVRAETDWSRPLPVPVLTSCGAPYERGLMINPLLAATGGSFRLICPPEDGNLFLLGSDRLGRDILSRIIFGARLSLTVGLIGVALSFAVGLLLGGMAGYFGGIIDASVSRAIEIFRSLPELPIWLALSAAVPVNWSPLSVFFMISIILGLLDWPGLARAVR